MIELDKLSQMKTVLGYGYPQVLADKLCMRGVLNSKGLPITPDYIRQIFQGRINNIEVLNIIIDDYKIQKRKMTKMSKKISKL